MIHVFPLATFTLGATATWGGATAAGEKYLDIANEGTVTTSGAGGVATLNADYWTSGKTVVGGGWIVDLLGLGEQNAGSFQLNRGTVKMSSPGRPLGIRGGELVGSGTVQGSLVLGGGASASAPILSPWSIGDMPSGLISVIGNFQIFSGKVQVGIGGPGADRTDRVEVTGYAALSGGTAVGLLRADYRFRGPRDRAVFLKANPVLTDFTGPTPPAAWKYDSTAAECWFEPLTGQIKGKASRDDNQNGVFEPWLGEMSLPGVGVALLDEDGVELDRTVTDGGGSYDFGEHIYGNYQVRFDRPADLRPSPQHAGYNSYSDSDYDVGTLIAAVTLDETHPTTAPNADALFRPLTAADDYYATPFRTPVSGNVLDNDPPPAGAGDALAVALGTGPAGGTVVLNPDGSFTYTPDDDFRGTDTFTYVVSDGYGLTATATVTIVVAPPPPAYVTGRVWDDGWIYYHTPYDLDGLQHTEWMDPGRSVTVALLDADGQIVATTTSEGMYGFYSFEVAVAGSYRVRFSLPDVPGMEFHFTLPNAGDDAIDSDADEWGETDLFVIDYGETVTRDAGVYWVYGDTFP